MFEQSIYDTEPVATPTSEGDLFHNYEIRNWDLSSRIYKIVGLSALGNIIAILIVAQTSLLTMKGCDSPLVGRVCSVLDTVYVSSLLFGTDREYVDAAYDKTELGDSDITFVDVSNVDAELPYPSSFLDPTTGQYVPMLGQPAMTMPADPGLIASDIPPGFPITEPSTGGSLLDTKPITPPVNDHVVDGDLPSFGSTTPSTTGGRKGRRGGRITPDDSATASASPKPTPSPEATPMTSDAVTALEINKKPLTDFAEDVATKWDAKQIDLNQPFTVVMNGVLTADGKLDKDKSKFDVSKQKGDPKMIDVAKAAIEAVGDSNFLSYLKSLNVDKISITLVQDDTQVTAVITSTQKTAERASVIASGLNGYISLGKIKFSDPKADERVLLDSAKVTADGKNFVFNFVLPKPIAQDMINRKLKEAQAKKALEQKPNGNIVTKTIDNSGTH